jgi:hypothetical protein
MSCGRERLAVSIQKSVAMGRSIGPLLILPVNRIGHDSQC